MFICRICNAKESAVLLENCKGDSGFVRSLRKCGSCSFVSIDPLPSVDELKNFYDDDYWHAGKKDGGEIVEKLFSLRMRPLIRGIKKLVPEGGRVLDWGAGDGKLKRLLSKMGYNCRGIDLYKSQGNDERLINTTIENADFKEESFDAITCFHVLEHIEEPLYSLKQAFKLLKKGGVFILEVPNIDSLGFKIFKQRWQPLEIPTHINHFSLKSLRSMFGFIEGARIIRYSWFSGTVSASSIVLSVFPGLAPKKMRGKYEGKIPLYLLAIYFGLQAAVYPLAILESAVKRGAVVRLVIEKT